MSHRLQILLDASEIEAVRAAARRRSLTVSEYVRRTLREARADEPEIGTERKLLAVREAAAHAYPTAEIDEMVRQIRAGYLDDGE